ncbi:MAG: hypothetical protein WBI21_01810 [Natronincolaceae bacterium]|jgi:hypothetical protein|nr:hypothetical protein [Clostridiales bacterium]
MDKRSKIMLIITIVLILILIIKSNLIDPVHELDGDIEKYRLYSLQTAPLGGGILKNTGLLTYRVVKVKQDSSEDTTAIIIKDENSGKWVDHIIEGQYSGKVRVYLFNFVPIKDIYFKGGIKRDNEISCLLLT